MNVSRFQIALNHEDPTVIISGLKSFSNQILKEHDALYAFGYNGRSINSLLFSSSSNILYPYYSKINELPVGLLALYLKSSPQIEELFVLWNLQGYDINKELCPFHMKCMASILFCSHNDDNFCNVVINRIISEYSKSILSQLGSSNQNVIHSTLGLCIAIARVSKQHACDTYQKLMISNNLFATLLQRGKAASWSIDDIDTDNNNHNIYNNNNKKKNETITTDSRLLITIWFLLIMDAADNSIAREIVSSTSFLRRITNGIHKDPFHTIIIILNGLTFVRNNSITLIQSKLVDSTFQERLIELYKHDDDNVQEAVHMFLSEHCKHLVNSLKSYKKSDNVEFDNGNNGNVFYAALSLIRSLQPHVDLRHRIIQMIILNSQPSMLISCLSSLNVCKDPYPNIDYLSSISHLVFLIQNVGIDKNLKSLVKHTAISSSKDYDIKIAINKIMQYVLPSDFQKNSFTKILLHQNAMIQRMGLILVKVVAQRISKIVPAKNVLKCPKFEAALAVCLEEHLPDIQILVNMWNRYIKSNEQNERTNYLLNLVLDAMESIINIFPSSISEGTFDLLRILDDYVVWNVKENAKQSLSMLNSKNSITMLNIVNLLRTATLHKRCKWFGTKDDIVKVLTNIIVTEDWSNNVKRDPLAKLLILANCDNEQLKNDARNLFRLVLNQTEIFDNEPILEYEMSSESMIWQEIQSPMNNSIILISIIMRIAYHWSTNYMIAAEEMRGKLPNYKGYVSTLTILPRDNFDLKAAPFSAAFYCSLSLCSSNFTILINELPSHLKSHLMKQNSDSNKDNTFYQKFMTGFQTDLQEHLVKLITLCTIRARNKLSYIKEVLLTNKNFNIFNQDSMITKLEQINGLVSVFQNNHSISSAKEVLSEIISSNNLNVILQDDVDNTSSTSKKRKLKGSEHIYPNLNGDNENKINFQLVQDPSSIVYSAFNLEKYENESKEMEGTWLFVTGLYLNISDKLSTKLLSWIKCCYESSIVKMQLAETGIEQQASFIAQSIELLTKITKLLGKYDDDDDDDDDHNTPEKRSRRISNWSSDSNSSLLVISKICSMLERFSIDLLFSSSCNRFILELLDSQVILSEFKNYTYTIGSLIRKIFCVASSIQLRKYYMDKKDFVRNSLWENVAKSFDAKSVFQDQDLSLFGLGWALQSFLNDENLKIMFINKIFDALEGYSILDLIIQNGMIENTSRDSNLMLSKFGIMNSIASSIFMSAQKIALCKSLHDYILQPCMKSSDTRLTNTMIGITVGIHSIPQNSYDLRLSEFHFYYDNILFFDPKLSIESYSIISKVSHKYSTINCLSAFERMKLDCEKKRKLSSFQQIISNICSNVINNSIITMEGVHELLEQNCCIAETPSTDIKNILIDLMQSIILSDNVFLKCIMRLLSENYLSNETFIANFTIILLKEPDQFSNSFLTTASIVIPFLLCTLVTIKKDSRKVPKFMTLFGDIFCEIIAKLLDESTKIVSSLQFEENGSSFQQLSVLFQILNLLFFQDFKSNWSCDENMKLMLITFQSKKSSVKSKMNKFIKSCLKWGITVDCIIENISVLVCRMQCLNESKLLWDIFLTPELNDVYHPQMLLQMIVGHSKFLEVLYKDIENIVPNISMLKLLLHLISYSISIDAVDSSTDEYLVKSILSAYTGKLTQSDRIILRILYSLCQVKRCSELCSLELSGLIRKSSNIDSKYSANSRSWITSVLTQANVYSTLSNFPFWRSLVPQPLTFEGQQGASRYNDDMMQSMQFILNEWGNCDENGEMSDDKSENFEESESDENDDSSMKEVEDMDIDIHSEDSVPSDCSFEVDSESSSHLGKNHFCKNIRQLLSNHENEITIFFDHLLDCSDKIYDPSYWLPVLHYNLQQYDLSMRQFFNSGAVSLVIASLGSCCPLLRTIALSCLQLILKYLRRQDRTKDAAFRERPQLLLLINFIRNSLSYDKEQTEYNGNQICPKLPPTIALTLGRAAMHLLQPSNELFGAINKYLLSRPYCDFKDLPMWEILVMNADIISEQSKRLMELRLIRDGLNSKMDHLNLCRKNGYGKLMLMFPLLIKDSKISHAILDILDKVISLQHSARYLIQRCDLIFWLKQMIIPFKSLDMEKDMEGEFLNDSRKSSSKNFVAIPTYILPRLLNLLRRTIGACYLLTSSSEISGSIYSDLNTVLLSILDSICLIRNNSYSHVTFDFLHKFVLCLWEFMMTFPEDSQYSSSQLTWDWNKIFAIAIAITNDSRRESISKTLKNDFLTSVFGLISFNKLKGQSRSINNDSIVSSNILVYMMSCMTDRLGIKPNHDDTTYLSILKYCKNSKNDNAIQSHTHPFFTSMNVFFEDGSINTISNNIEINSFIDFNYNLQRSWYEFSRLKIEDMELPTSSIDSKSVLAITTKAMLNLFVCLGNDKRETSELINLFDKITPKSMIRWTLTMHNIFSNSNNHFESKTSTDSLIKEKLKCRILSVIDSGINIAHYTKSFCDFQLLLRLTILSILSLEFDHFNSIEKTTVKSLRSVLIKSMKILTMSKLNTNELNSRESTILLLRDTNDGFDVWNSCYNKAIIVEICLLVNDLAGAFISFKDKYDLNKSRDKSLNNFSDYLFKMGPLRLDKLCSLVKMNNDQNIHMDCDNSPIASIPSSSERNFINDTKFNSRFFQSADSYPFNKEINDNINKIMKT